MRLWKIYIEQAIKQELDTLIEPQGPGYAVVTNKPGIPVRVMTRHMALAETIDILEKYPVNWHKMLAQQSMITFMCLFCGFTDGHRLLEPVYIIPRGIFGYFATNVPAVNQVLVDFCRARHDEIEFRYTPVAGLCNDCVRSCVVCQKLPPMNQITLEELESFYLQHACIACVGGSIATLSLAKPNTRDLKVFRRKLTCLHQES